MSDNASMTMPIGNLTDTLARLRPVRNPGVYCFCQVGDDVAVSEAIGTFREPEGKTVIVPEEVARDRGWPVAFRAAWITLMADTDLGEVGLTAAVTAALAGKGIACNVVAAVRHDHLFVPVERGEEALAILRAAP